MGRERMPQAMWISYEPTHRARVQSSSSRGEEERIRHAVCEGGSRVAEVERHAVRRLFPERHHSRLPTFAPYVNRFPFEIEVGEVEADCFGAPQPSRVEEFEERAVSESECRMSLGEPEQLVHLRLLRRVRQPSRPAR